MAHEMEDGDVYARLRSVSLYLQRRPIAKGQARDSLLVLLYGRVHGVVFFGSLSGNTKSRLTMSFGIRMEFLDNWCRNLPVASPKGKARGVLLVLLLWTGPRCSSLPKIVRRHETTLNHFLSVSV